LSTIASRQDWNKLLQWSIKAQTLN